MEQAEGEYGGEGRGGLGGLERRVGRARGGEPGGEIQG